MTTIFLTGCFDILTRAHIELIDFASKIGNKLIIAIDTDLKVKQDKGQNRPYNNQNDRKFVLEHIKGINEVILFNTEEELINLLKTIKPDVRVAGSDWRGKKIVGEEYCKTIVYFDRISGYSTTNVLKGIKPYE